MRIEKRDAVKRKGLGASEVPAIMNYSPWSTDVSVWLEKVDLAPPRPDTASMLVGRMMEAAILDIVDLTYPASRNRMTFLHPDWPEVPLFATPDGFTRRRRGLVEIKVVGHRWEDWRGGPPLYVAVQCQAQMAVYRKADYAIVGALIGSEVKTFEVPRDPVLVEAIEADVAAWWKAYVLTETAPPAVTDMDRWSLARAIAAHVDRAPRTATEGEELIAARLAATIAERAHLDRAIDADRLALAELAADSDLTGAAGWRATWSERKSTDWPAIRPLIPRYLVDEHTTTSRVFTFRRGKATDAELAELAVAEGVFT